MLMIAHRINVRFVCRAIYTPHRHSINNTKSALRWGSWMGWNFGRMPSKCGQLPIC